VQLEETTRNDKQEERKENHVEASQTVSAETLEARITDALVEFGADPEQVGRQARLDDLEVDSLDLVELAQIVEDEFGIEVTADSLEGVETVGDAIDAIVRASG
jgi:acyl carrier protein